jgi:hypothetical protein
LRAHVHSDQQQQREEEGGQKEEAAEEEAAEEEFVIIYDRLANGWGGPPGQWGELDRVFSMRFKLVV